MSDKINRQSILEIISKYKKGSIGLSDISEFTFDVIMADEEVIEDSEEKLIIEVVHYLNNIEDGIIYHFSPPDMDFLEDILKSIKDEGLAINFVLILEARHHLLKVLKAYLVDKVPKEKITEMIRKIHISQDLVPKITNLLKDKNSTQLLNQAIEKRSVGKLEKLLVEY